MLGDGLLLEADDHAMDKALDHHFAVTVDGWHRVGIAIEGDQALLVDLSRGVDAALERCGWQGEQEGFLLQPTLTDGLLFAAAPVCFQPFAAGQQLSVQLGPCIRLGNRDHEVAADVAHLVFHQALLVALSGCAEATFEQIVGAERNKGLLLLAVVPFQDPLHGLGEVIVPQSPRHATEKLQGRHLPFEKGFLALMREGHDERQGRVAQDDHQVLSHKLLAGDDNLCFPEIDLPILAGTELQGNEDVGASDLESLFAQAHEAAHGGFGSLELMLISQSFIDAMGCVPLLAGTLLIVE